MWPELPYSAWKDTLDTLHMNLQIVGKVRLALTPFEPQWANVPLYLISRGLTTTPMEPAGAIWGPEPHRPMITLLAAIGAQSELVQRLQPHQRRALSMLSTEKALNRGSILSIGGAGKRRGAGAA